jgi:hypothetical protein
MHGTLKSGHPVKSGHPEIWAPPSVGIKHVCIYSVIGRDVLMSTRNGGDIGESAELDREKQVCGVAGTTDPVHVYNKYGFVHR